MAPSLPPFKGWSDFPERLWSDFLEPTGRDSGGAPRIWDYDAGQPWSRRKHAWGREEAGFEKRGRVTVAKCPSNIRREHATRLLNSPNRLELRDPRGSAAHPDRIYVFAQGVLDRAVPTVAGRSYHAFPEHAKGVRELTYAHQQRLWAWARSLNIEQQVKQWLNRT